jgi:hypothetical protein
MHLCVRDSDSVRIILTESCISETSMPVWCVCQNTLTRHDTTRHDTTRHDTTGAVCLHRVQPRLMPARIPLCPGSHGSSVPGSKPRHIRHRRALVSKLPGAAARRDAQRRDDCCRHHLGHRAVDRAAEPVDRHVRCHDRAGAFLPAHHSGDQVQPAMASLL